MLSKEGEQRQPVSQRAAWDEGTAGELGRLREDLRQRGDQLAAMRAEILGLEATRNECAFATCSMLG